MTITIQDVFGIAGTIMVIVSYLLLQLDRISASNLSYSLLNAVGAALILYSLFYDFNLAAMVIEGFWILISVFGIWKYFRSHKAVK